MKSIKRYLWERRSAALIGLALAATLGVRLLMLAARVRQTIAYPFQFDPTEGILLSEFVLLQQRVNIYAPFTAERFISAPYPPVYYLLVTPLLRFTGVSFFAGRLVALLATLMIAVLLALLVANGGADRTDDRRRARPWALALLAAGLWLTSLPALVWATRLKPDLLAVAFSLGGVALIQAYPRRLLLPVLCFALAFGSKQSAIAGGVAVGLWLLLRDWRQGIRFGLWQLAAIAVPFAILDWLTRHGFWIHMVDYHALPWSAQRWLGIVWDVVSFHWALALLAFAYLLVSLMRRGRRIPLPALYLGVALLTSFSGGTFGGFHNHALELLAALCLGSGLMLKELRTWPAAQMGALIMLAVQLLLWSAPPPWLTYEYTNLPSPATTARLRSIQSYAAGQRGPVWGDNVGLIVTAGRPVRFNDPLIMAQAALLGWWDERLFVQMLRQGDFDALLWRADLLEGSRPNDLTPAMLSTIRARYRLQYPDVLRVYVPNEP